jgi:hypothetical protein
VNCFRIEPIRDSLNIEYTPEIGKKRLPEEFCTSHYIKHMQQISNVLLCISMKYQKRLPLQPRWVAGSLASGWREILLNQKIVVRWPGHDMYERANFILWQKKKKNKPLKNSKH